jgi:chromosome segregation protein
MRLQQLEIKGFKSFATQTVINFDADVIGIVGPNGSGKSNIVDAIRWVLGEQKGKELRLDKMSSIIFNGTKKKKPGNVASVSLTFANDKGLLPTDYHQVTITRMLYRSGDSEYRLNGVTCRLKDIRNLFLDTGIGSNSYAIIALGMVDDILADKDNSRRRMFEQAAGISKYKNRKKESLRKLKHTEDDLDRIEDLLHEITANLGKLEKQAKRARKYRQLKQQYRELSLLLTGIRLEKLRLEEQKGAAEIAAAETTYRELDRRITAAEEELSRKRSRQLERESAVGERQRKLNALVGELRGLENDRQLLEQRKDFVARQSRQLTTTIERAGQQLEDHAIHLQQLQDQLATAGERMQELARSREEAENELTNVRAGHAGLKEELDAALRQQQGEERRVYELEKERAINASRIENIAGQIERNRQQLNSRREEHERLTAELDELRKREEEAEREVAELEERETTRRDALEQSEARNEHLRAELNRINRGLDARRNEYNLTKSMVDSLEGFPESIRYLSKQRGWARDVQLLSDVILVDENYRVAIEGFLEPWLNHYVVGTAEEAAAGIKLLRENRKGKATFFILEQLPAARLNVSRGPAGSRPATEVVQVDAPFRPLIEYLLGGVFVSDGAIESVELPEGTVLLSADGTLSRRPYRLGGGSVGLFAGKKIGRKKNLEVLAKAITTAEAEATNLQGQLDEERSKLNELRQQRLDQIIQRQRRELGKLQQQRAGLGARVESFGQLFATTESQNEQLGREREKLLEQNATIDERLLALNAQIEQLRGNVSGTDANYRALSENLSAASSRFNQENIQYIQQQNRVAGLEQEITFRQDRVREVQREEQTSREELGKLEAEAQRFGEQEDVLNRNLSKLREERTTYKATLSEAEQAYVAARTAIQQAEDAIRRDGRQLQEAQVRVNQLKERATDVRFKLQSVAERLRIEFDLSLEQLAEVEVEEWTGTVADLELKVDRLRGRIGNYGEINPLAVEAYDEMQERHATITGQRDDILAAKATLNKTIREIEETATAQFLHAFDRVRLYFIDVFRSLFTEDDNCDLILLDPENPLESGIEIVAKPKGKRPQTINQLSGGEKTLTATALLFALYLLKPAPFCIFDEVDAPLDDANIHKFNRIIKKFSQDSQFIIVTHNKLTMEAVESIYGVYTTEQGGSGVLPVRFTELEGSTTFSAV